MMNDIQTTYLSNFPRRLSPGRNLLIYFYTRSLIVHTPSQNRALSPYVPLPRTPISKLQLLTPHLRRNPPPRKLPPRPQNLLFLPLRRPSKRRHPLPQPHLQNLRLQPLIAPLLNRALQPLQRVCRDANHSRRALEQ
jgi:hypothetical protein